MTVLITLYLNLLTILQIYLAAYSIGDFMIGNGTIEISQIEFGTINIVE